MISKIDFYAAVGGTIKQGCGEYEALLIVFYFTILKKYVHKTVRNICRNSMSPRLRPFSSVICLSPDAHNDNILKANTKTLITPDRW